MQPIPAQYNSLEREVIIIGRRAEDALEQCLDSGCPPDAEVEAALAASVEQFSAARYTEARRTLQRAIRRNRVHTAALPGPISRLHATLATVAQHEGDQRLMIQSARANVQILDTHIGPYHPSTLAERLTQGDLLAASGAAGPADTAYSHVRERALAGGHAVLAAEATFRRAWLALLSKQFDEAKRLGDDALVLGAGDPTVGNTHAILRARIATRGGDESAVDGLVQQLRQASETRPSIMFQPQLFNLNPDRGAGGSDSIREFRDVIHDSAIRYADIGYWIRPDGRTAEVEILRSNGLGQWGPGIIRQVEGRRFVPTDAKAGVPGIYRIDRYTVRANLGVPIGSRIRRRIGDLSVHVVDLTETDAMDETRRRQMEQTQSF